MVLLPWFQEDLRQKPNQLISDCDTCKAKTTQLNRQGRGCGYEPPAPRTVSVMPWLPPQTRLGYRHPRPTVCAGYLTRLPEVLEIARAYPHFDRGALPVFCGSDPPTEALLRGLELFDAELAQLKVYALTPIDKGGGRS